MKPYRGNAIAAGVLFLTCTAASVLSAVPLGTTLDGSGYLSRVADNGQGVVVAALIEFVWAATGAGIAIALYPVLRTWHRGLALGSVAGRVAEAMFVLIGTLSLLTLSTVSQEAAKSGAAARSSFQVTADTLLATRDWAHGFLAMLAFVTGVLLYYYVLYTSRLIPRWLSGWGLVAAALTLIATVYAGFTHDFGFTTVNTVLNIPILVQELVLAVWLLVKGFNQAATPLHPGDPVVLREGRSPASVSS